MKTAIILFFIVLMPFLCFSMDKEYFDHTDSSESFPLHDACRKGDIERLKGLLAQPNVDVNELGDYCEETPLYVACENNQLACVKLLLAIPGINVNKNGFMHGQSPFWIAETKGHEDIIDLLASHEDINIWYKNWVPLWRTIDKPTCVLEQYKQMCDDYIDKTRRVLEKYQRMQHDYDVLQNEGRQGLWFTRCILPEKSQELSAIENRLHYLLHIIVLYKRYNVEIMPSLFAHYKTTYQKCHPEPIVTLEQENVRREKKLHHQLRASHKRMQCALFIEFLQHMGIKSNADHALLIAHYYCQLNNQLLVAWFYRKDPYYYALPEKQRERIKKTLLHKNRKCLDDLWAHKK